MTTRTILFAGLAACTSATPTHFTGGGDEISAVVGHPYHWSFDDGTEGSLPADLISVLGDWKLAA